MSNRNGQWPFLLLLGLSAAGHLYPLTRGDRGPAPAIPAQEGVVSVAVRLSASSLESRAAPSPQEAAALEHEQTEIPQETPAEKAEPVTARSSDPAPPQRQPKEALAAMRNLLAELSAQWPTTSAETSSIAESKPGDLPTIAETPESLEGIDPAAEAAPVEQQPKSQPTPKPKELENIESPGPSSDQVASQSARPKPVGVRSEARLLGKAVPRYPAEAQRRGIEGQVLLRLHLTVTGAVDVATVARSSGSELLDQAALEFATSIQFAPAREDEAAVESVIHLPVTFRLVAQ